MFLLAVTLAVVGLLTLAELRFGHHLTAERLTNLGVALLGALTTLTLLPLVSIYVRHSLVDGRALPYALDLALFVLTVDLGEYAFHRAQHAIPWLWALHALHHSDADMNATTTERHFWGEKFIKSVSIWPAAALIVSPSPAVGFTYALLSLWNYVGHSRLPLSFGRFSWLLNSPAYHRRHHSSLPEHYNSNFAALLPIWDVLLGSYHVPCSNMPPTGLSGPPPGPLQIIAWPLWRSPPLRRRVAE